MDTEALSCSWRSKLPIHMGNPQHRQRAEKQSPVEKPTVSNATSKKQIIQPCASWKAQEWLSNEGTFSSINPQYDGLDDDNQTIATSMVAHASTASTTSTVSRDLVAISEEHTLDQAYLLVSNASNDSYFLGMGDWQNIPRLYHRPNTHDLMDSKLHPPVDYDVEENNHQCWKDLADKQDVASGDWGRTRLNAPSTSTPSEPAPSLVTDCSTVESEAVAIRQCQTNASGLSLGHRYCPPSEPYFLPTNDFDFDEDVCQNNEPHTHFKETYNTPTQRTGPRGGGRGGHTRRGRGGHNRGGSTSSNLSAPRAASFDSSSSRPSGELKRRQEDDDPDENGQGNNKEPPKRVKPNDAERKRLACPFTKHDPQKHIDCIKFNLMTIGHLKQHLKRYHYKPIYCPTCGDEFETRGTCDLHIEQRSCNQVAFNKVGINEDKQRLIGASRPRNTDDANRWFLLWDIIFPNEIRPSDPYQLDLWQAMCNIVLGMFRRHSDTLATTFVSNGCTEDSAQANIQSTVDWMEHLGRLNSDESRVTETGVSTSGTGSSSLDTSDGQELTNNTAPDNTTPDNAPVVISAPSPAPPSAIELPSSPNNVGTQDGIQNSYSSMEHIPSPVLLNETFSTDDEFWNNWLQDNERDASPAD